jgi:hypothetical protein
MISLLFIMSLLMIAVKIRLYLLFSMVTYVSRKKN